MKLDNLPEISSPLPWHEQEWKHLNEQLSAGQLPHAFLLVGSQYSGKSQLTLAFSRLLLCAQPEGLFNCGKCHACELSASGGHGDFRWVEPEEKSRVIKIDQIREVVQFSNKTAGFGLRKVIVLAPADTMNVSAFNALLKSLEEPSDNTYLILVCHRMYGVPATIRSRCRILRIGVPAAETSLEWLDKTTGDREESKALLALSDQRPLLAQLLYYSGKSQEFAHKRIGLEALLADRITVQQASGLWSDTDMDDFLENLVESLQRLSSELPVARLRSKLGRRIFLLLDEVLQLRRAVSSGSNPNKQLLVEATLSKIRRQLGRGLLGDTIGESIGEVSL